MAGRAATLFAAESANDFVHKLKVCLKELRESYRWLRLVQTVPLVPPKRVTPLVTETDELIHIFVTSIRTDGGKKRPDTTSAWTSMLEVGR